MKQIVFEIPAQNGYPLYRDALWVEDGSVLTDEEIETMKQDRYTAWKNDMDFATTNIEPRIDSDPLEVEPPPAKDDAEQINTDNIID